MRLARRQRLAVKYIEWHYWRFGYVPSRQHLARAFGVTLACVDKWIQRFLVCGYLLRVSTHGRRLHYIPSGVFYAVDDLKSA